MKGEKKRGEEERRGEERKEKRGERTKARKKEKRVGKKEKGEVGRVGKRGVILCPDALAIVSYTDPTQLMRGKGVWCHKSKSLG